jgi:hypothetical protein
MDHESHPTAESLIEEIRMTEHELARGDFRHATRIQLAIRKAIDLLEAGKISPDEANAINRAAIQANATLRRAALGKRI